eukprot:symbB.v1.2.039856.t1/scaffold6833.1/size15150/2
MQEEDYWPSATWKCRGSVHNVATQRRASPAVAEVEIAGLVEGKFPGTFSPSPSPEFLQRRLEVWDRLWQKAQEELQEKPKQLIEVNAAGGVSIST